MKQSIYQKLLLSLAIATFFVALASAQVMDRNQVAPEMIELQKKAKAQGLSEVPASWIQEALQARAKRELAEQTTLVKPTQQLESKPLSKLNARQTEKKPQKKATEIPKVERKLMQNNKLSLREKAKQITPPPGFKVVIKEVRGKEYIRFVELPEQNGIVPPRAKN